MKELQSLVAGYKEFSSKEKRDGQYRYSKLAQGQSPRTMVISCCDSRVSPSLIFNVQPGNLFIVRNVANLVPPFEKDGTYHGTSAALEFAVLGLKVERIVVMGHSQCGGIQACIDHHKQNGNEYFFIKKWLSILEPVTRDVFSRHDGKNRETLQRMLELESIKTSLNNLESFPFISEQIEKQALNIHGAYFDVEDGQLYLLEKKSGQFEKVD